MEKVLFFGGPWNCFSNFSAFKVNYMGIDWMTSEHAYQASKFFDEKIFQEILTASSAYKTIECQDCGVRYKFVQQKNHFHIYIISLENIINSSYECNCSCHQTGAIHIVACCDQCKICGKNIKIQMMNKHLKTCHHKK